MTCSTYFWTSPNQKTGKAYRPPTEAEWEYACRGGVAGERYRGGSDLDRLAWYDGNSGGKTQPVGQKPANDFGLYDMSGNVWEWVQDCWHDTYKGAPADGRAWETGGDCQQRVLRGASFFYRAEYLRSSVRYWNRSGNRGRDGGFRRALGLVAPTLPALTESPSAPTLPEIQPETLSAGGWHTCRVKGYGTVACRGNNEYDQATQPAGVFTQVNAGDSHTCGVKSDGAVTCWGANDHSQAGRAAHIARTWRIAS
ncbi:MAG: SUMF1/EgtB/PvdO family nonheme iron enzyme, partial [Candidatus Competibacter sp.]|nr:SUMF1/EgtB/PvdO family nonheme iron enzyme [Candidatus Competibacter sp.]